MTIEKPKRGSETHTNYLFGGKLKAVLLLSGQSALFIDAIIVEQRRLILADELSQGFELSEQFNFSARKLEEQIKY